MPDILSRPVSQMISVRVPMIAATIGLPDPAATARWKPRSWRRKAWGSSSVANIPVISSAIAASCSPVARSAASAAAPTSSIRRASYIWSSVKPWSAARNSSGARPSWGGPSTMNVPAPRREVMMPIACRRSQPRAQRGPAEAHLQRELALGGQPVAGAEAAGHDLAPDVLDHLAADRRVAQSSGPTVLASRVTLP